MSMRNVLYFVAGGCVTWLVFGGDRSTPKNQANVSSAATFKSKQAIAEPKCTHTPYAMENATKINATTKPVSSIDSGLIVLTLVFTFLGAFFYWLVRDPLVFPAVAYVYLWKLGDELRE